MECNLVWNYTFKWFQNWRSSVSSIWNYKSGLLIFRVVAELRISNLRNPAKFVRNLTKYMSAKCFESYLGCWGRLLAVNLLIYLETLSPQRVNNIPKLPGVLRLMLRKTGKQRCKNPGVPSVIGKLGMRVWRYCVLAREECCVLWRITS